MRKLNMADVFATLRLIRSCGLREEIKPLLKRAIDEGASAEAVGIDGMLVLVEVLSGKETEHGLFEVLSGPFEKTPEEMAAMPLDELLEGLCQIGRENDLKRFFAYVSGTLGKK